MKIFKTLTQTSPNKVFLSLFMGTLAGIGYSLLIPIILNSFDEGSMFKVVEQKATLLGIFEVSNVKFAILFIVSCLAILTTRTLSQLILSRVAIDTTSALRIKYYNAILQTPLLKLEQVGSSRLIASFTTDIKMIMQGAVLLPDLLISLITVLGMMGFLLYLNADIFLLICGAIGFGVLTFQVPMMLATRFFKRARDKVDHLQEGIRGNIYGVKELKLCSSKRNSYIEDVLLKTENEVRGANKTAISIVRALLNYGDMINFFVIGYVAFIFINYHAVTAGELLGAIMVMLYITGPIGAMMSSLPLIVNANISFVKIEKLFKELPNENIETRVQPLSKWQQLRFSKVCYHYDIDEGIAFNVGPIDLEINKGEVTFVVGGNGSGKSTLSKLITTHYLRKSGDIFLDDQLIDDNLITSFRDQISAIFSDFHLFDRLLGNTKWADKEVVNNYLKRLQLDHKVKLVGNRFSTLALSDGQKKRLALLVAFLEDKELYLFDEWASDQDPEFKHVFYYDILPYLKAKGKAVVVISHDDRYFEVADSILTMENGSLRSQTRPNKGPKNDVLGSIAANSQAVNDRLLPLTTVLEGEC
jgi:putative ATP-binding cassette transporter